MNRQGNSFPMRFSRKPAEKRVCIGFDWVRIGFELGLIGFVLGLYWVCIGFVLGGGEGWFFA